MLPRTPGYQRAFIHGKRAGSVCSTPHQEGVYQRSGAQSWPRRRVSSVPLTGKRVTAAHDHGLCSLRADRPGKQAPWSACPTYSYQTFKMAWLTFLLPIEPEGEGGSCEVSDDTGNAKHAGLYRAFWGPLPHKKNIFLMFIFERERETKRQRHRDRV